MNYLLDTNVISEVRKRDRCHPAVAAWWENVSAEQIYLSTLVIGEIRKGIELVRVRDLRQADRLERWLEDVISTFADRIIPICTDVAHEWGRVSAIRPVPVIDALLAATAGAKGLVLVTRNTPDVAGLGVDVLNPFEAVSETTGDRWP